MAWYSSKLAPVLVLQYNTTKQHNNILYSSTFTSEHRERTPQTIFFCTGCTEVDVSCNILILMVDEERNRMFAKPKVGAG